MEKRTLFALLVYLILIAASLYTGALVLQSTQNAEVTVRWATATELNTAGFNLCRSATPAEKDCQLINDRLIPPAPDTLAGGDYSFVDLNAGPGQTYYYFVQEVEYGGTVNAHGPIKIESAAVNVVEVVVVVLSLLIGIFGLSTTLKNARQPPAT